MNKFKALLVLMGMEIGGAETHVLELAIGLKQKGIDVQIASNGGVYVKELEANGIKHFNVPLHNKKPLNMLKSLFRLAKIIRTERPDVVHGHARIPSFLLGILNKFMKFRFVTTAHWVFNTDGLLKHLTNWGYRTIAVSNDIKQYLIENYGTNPQDITVTINGINMKKFAPDKDASDIIEEFGLSKDKRKIVYISRMDEDRSLVAHHLIEIAPELIKTEDVEIVIVGGGNDFENVKAMADSANQKAGHKYIFLTGARTDIYKFVAIADFMVAVSRSALEAMSAKVPVIVAGNEGYLGIFEESKLPDAIRTNFCCRGMAEPSPDLLLRDMTEMLRYSEEQLDALGTYGRELIRTNYSVDRMVADNLSVYEDIIANGNNYFDFVISGYYGYKNSGDDALLFAIIDGIKKHKTNARFAVLSANPKETIETYGVNSIDRFNVFKIRRALKSSRMLISGGGSLIQDATSTKSLVYYISIIKMALKCNCRVMLYANGIGPINKKKNKKRASVILPKVDLITLRDEKSLRLLEELNIPMSKVVLTADPANLLAPSNEERAEEILREENIPEGNYVAISVRNWKNDAHICKTLSEISKYIKWAYKLTPIFIPMQIPDDVDICTNCRNEADMGYVLKNRYDFHDIMALIKKCHLVIGMRLHLLMYAAIVATPVIGLVYDPKVKGYLEAMEQSYTLDVSSISFSKLKAMVDEIMKNRDSISKTLSKKTENAKKLADKNGEYAAMLCDGITFIK